MSIKSFQKNSFNAQTNHNARFAKKNLVLNYNTLDALTNYFENGGTITVCKAGRRSKANISFPQVHGTVSNLGAKQVSLKNAGVKSRRG